MDEEIRVLLVGDRNVGKTSLVTSLLRDGKSTFAGDQLPPFHDCVTIPSTAMETPGIPTTHIIDTSLRTQAPEEVMSEIAKASVICIVYAVNEPKSFARLGDYWLPMIRKSLGAKDGSHGIPVLLIGNKIDTFQDDALRKKQSQDLFDLAGTNGFSEVTVCLQCSAKQMANVNDVFHYAQLSAVYPATQLYDRSARALKPACKDAFTRIFVMCDTNKDGFLDDDELRAFQQHAFQMDVSDEELEHVKQLVRYDNRDAVVNGKMTEKGFLSLMMRFFEKAQFQTIWEVLRQYGYSNDLRLTDDLLAPKLSIPADCATELSISGAAFLDRLFSAYASGTGNSAMLSVDQLAKMCSIIPGNSWLEQQLGGGSSSRRTFFLVWRFLVMDQPMLAIKYLAYLGYGQMGDLAIISNAIALSKRRVSECAAGRSGRGIFVCYACGSGEEDSDSSTAALSKALLNAGGIKITSEGTSDGAGIVVGPVSKASGEKESTLILKTFDVEHDSTAVMSDVCAQQCDVVCIFSDQSNSKSFSYATDLQSKVVVPGPQVLMVACGSAGGPSAAQYCKTRGMATSIELAPNVSAAPILDKVAELAAKPKLSNAATSSSWGFSNYLVVAGSLAAIAYFVHKRSK
eukprot:gene1200-992_t